MLPVTKYAQSGDVFIAYQISGHGPIDIVFAQGFISHLELMWDEPRHAPVPPWAGIVRPPHTI